MRIFISYSRIDGTDTANHISNYLGDINHNVFLDTSDIKVGDEWRKIVQQNILDCDIFLLVVTRSIPRREEVEKEVQCAKENNKRIISCVNKKYYVDRLPWEIDKYHAIYFERFDDLIQALDIQIEKIEKTGKLSYEKKYEGSSLDYQKLIQEQMKTNDLSKYSTSTLHRNEDSNSSKSKGRIAYNLLISGKYKEAIDCYDSMLQLEPHNTDFLFYKGMCLYNLGNYKEAIDCYDKVLEINPSVSRARSQRNVAYGKLDKSSSFRNFFRK